MRKGVLLLLVLLAFLSVRANNVQLQETVKIVSATGGLVTMEVSLSWENSWRDEYNWDAVWLFFKYKVGVDGAWQHATINTTGATVTAAGSDYTTMSATTGATAQGLFVCPSKARVGNTDSLKVRVQWSANHTEEQFKNNDVFIVAHGIEMVYIPYGTYTIGDGSSAGTFDKTVIDSEAVWNGASDNFPKGYQGFYVMKYETSQEQYVEFLNALTFAEQTTLIPGVDALNMGDFVFGNSKNAPNCKNSIILSGKITDKPLLFDSNLNNNIVYSEDGDGGTLAMNYMSITDACGYASWAGLRPMTEMEYEKACRRPYPQEPEAGEFAWNSATGAVNASGLTMQGSGREIAATGNVNAGGTINGPVRCGIFARPSTTSQSAAGATYWGVMEMSGNVSELCASITNTTISKTVNGTGSYNTSLYGSGPTGGHTGYGTRGGGFGNTHNTLTTSSRDAVSCFTTALQRDSTVGFRCVSTYTGESGVDAGTIAFSGNVSAVCPGETIAIANLTDANAGDFSITGYAWHINGVVVPGAVGASLTLDSVVGGQTYSIVRKAVCPLGEASTAALTVKVIAPKLLAGTITGGSRCGMGEVAVRNATRASIECGLPITYSWWVSGKEIAGQQGESLTHTFTAYGSIPVIRHAMANGTIADATTTVTVTSPAPKAGSITAATPRLINTPVTISNGSLGSVGCGSFTYSWFVNGAAVAGRGSSLTYTFTSLGTFTVIRRTTAADGTYANASATVSVVNCGAPVYDSQGNGYATKQMKDGRCWMVENLRFGVCNPTIFNQYRSTSTKDKIAPGYWGVCIASTVSGAGHLYNWQAAMNSASAVYGTGGNPSGNVDGNSTRQWQGICPTGWHLPSGGSTGEFQKLYTALGNMPSNIYPGTGVDGWRGVLGGYGDGASVTGGYGRYWNSTYLDTNNAYGLGSTSNSATPQGYNLKDLGFAVRCVKNY